MAVLDVDYDELRGQRGAYQQQLNILKKDNPFTCVACISTRDSALLAYGIKACSACRKMRIFLLKCNEQIISMHLKNM